MKKSVMAVWMVVLSSLAWGNERTLTVSTLDADGTVSVAIGGTGTQNQTLIAAWARADKGDDPLAWTAYADAGTIIPGQARTTYRIPDAWRAKAGVVRFFLMSEEKPYKERYDYITRPKCEDGELYINTAIVPDTSLDFTIKVRTDNYNGNPAMCPFGIASVLYIMPMANYNNAYYYEFFGASATTTYQESWGDGYGTGRLRAAARNVFGQVPPRDAQVHEFRLNREGLYIDGYRHLAFDPNTLKVSTEDTITLFGRNRSMKQAGTTCSIYSVRIVMNGELCGDFVPCSAPSGKVQMWDRVTKTWKAPAGTKRDQLRFVAGNAVGPYPSDCGTVTCVSAPLTFGPALSVTAPNAARATVSVSFPAGVEEGLLIAVADVSDKGTDLAAWSESRIVGRVPAGTTSLDVALPVAWWQNKYLMRLAWKPLADEPYDYKVERLHSDEVGKAHIQTGWVPTPKTSIVLTAKTRRNVCAFGIASHFCIFLNTDAKIYWMFFGNSGSNACTEVPGIADVAAFVANDHVWELGPTGARIDGTTLGSYTGGTEMTDYNSEIHLPFRASKKDSTLSGKEGEVSVKGATIWEDGERVRDYVPCVKDGKPGFYERVFGTFCPSKMEADFVAGPAIVAGGELVAWSVVRELRNGLTVIFR